MHLPPATAERLEALAGELGAEVTAGDVTQPGDLERAVAAAAAGGALAGLVFAVGSIDLAPVKRLTAEQFATAFALNVTAPALAVQAAAPALAAGEGAVVLYSSVAAGSGFRSHAVTGTVKAAVEGLTRSLAAELAPKVRVNAIAPHADPHTAGGGVHRQQPLLAEGIARQHPLGRLGEPEDLAGVGGDAARARRPLHHGRGNPCRRRPQQHRRLSAPMAVAMIHPADRAVDAATVAWGVRSIMGRSAARVHCVADRRQA